MDRRKRFDGRRAAWLLFVTTLSALALLAMSGCTVGPLNLGGGTPVPPTSTPSPTPTPRAVSGSVTDQYTGLPIPGADITAGGILTETTTEGTYSFDDVPKGSKLTAAADGYDNASADTGVANRVDIKLRPNTVNGRVTDATTGQPLAGVLVKLVLPVQPAAPITPTGSITPSISLTATTVPTATAPTGGNTFLSKVVAAPVGDETTATAVGVSSTLTTTALPTNTAQPPTATPTPRPLPPTGEGFVAVYTDDNGNYFFKNVPEGATLTFKMPGYKLTKAPIDARRKDMALAQFKTEGIYITANVAASPDILNPLLDFVAKSRINTVVLNVQDDASRWVYNTTNPEALAAQNTDIFLPNMPDLVKQLHARGLYVIARVVTFQQASMADARPDLAVMSSVTGKPWKGGYEGQQRWLDASNPKVQDYMVNMTKEVIGLGFDEVQFDYVRFPSDPAPSEPGNMVFSRPLTDTGKALAIEQFLTKAHAAIEPTDAFMSIDIFGYTLWPDQDGKPLNGVIGQVFENMVDHTDYVSPMIYPSHFSPGEQGCLQPEACAYQIIKKSGEYAAERFAGKKAKYRPWLEDFDWGNTDYTSPGTTKVADQMRAAKETNAWGWMWWDASNSYEPRQAFMK